jgi:hypothetical protein
VSVNDTGVEDDGSDRVAPATRRRAALAPDHERRWSGAVPAVAVDATMKDLAMSLKAAGVTHDRSDCVAPATHRRTALASDHERRWSGAVPAVAADTTTKGLRRR